LVKLVGNIENEIPLYEDPYMEDNKILKGHNGHIFLIANPKTSTYLYELHTN